MASAYIFTLQPTFTQGLILGQCSILFLLFLVLKYLFFDTDSERPYRKASYPPRVELDTSDEELAAARVDFSSLEASRDDGDSESTEWLNILLLQVCPYDCLAFSAVLNGILLGTGGIPREAA